MTSLPSPLVLPLLLALGCRPPDTAPKPQDTGTPTPPVDTADTAVPMDSGDTALPEDTAVLPDYDCDALFAEDIENNAIDWARAYHDTVFDLEGNLIGLDGGTGLVKSTYDGQRNLWVPGIVSAEGMDRLPDGSIVYANSARGRLDKVTPEGGQETLVSNVNGIKGVTVGPDGNIYYASGGVFRYDVLTEEVSTLLPPQAQLQAWHTVFSLDSTRLFIATYGQGRVYALDLDENLDAVGDAYIYADNVGNGWHDGIGIDACGNIYVAEYFSQQLYRVRTTGEVERIGIPNNSRQYGHGLEWGSGIGGWRSDALYVPLPYDGNKVREVVVSVPSGSAVRTWNGQPVRR